MMGEPRGSQGRAMSELISRPKPKCNRRIRILNGVTRIRERGSLARFQCSHGFMLIGPTTIVCLRDRWSEQPPICVRSACRTLQSPANGVIRQSIGGAVAQFHCLGSSELIGEPLLYCDGAKWNGSEPTCFIEPTTTIRDYDTSTEDQELWPVAVMTPPPPAADPKQESGADWDSNLEPVYSTTTIISERLPVERNVTIIKEFDVGTTSELTKPIEGTTIVYPSYSESQSQTHLLPVQPSVEESLGSVISTSLPIRLSFTTEQIPVTQEKSPDATAFESSNNANVIATIRTTIPPPAPPLSTTTKTTKIMPTTTTTTTAAPPKIIPVTPPRKTKISKRTRRPTPSKGPIKKPSKTTARPRKPTIPKEVTRSYQKPTTYPPVVVLATTERKNNVVPIFVGPDTAPSPLDYPIAIDKEPLSREYVEPIRPILPDMLNINQGESGSNQHSKLAHASMIGGISLFIIGLTTFSARVLLYYWRKNKGIARARPYDMDGRTLSAHDANDDFTWM